MEKQSFSELFAQAVRRSRDWRLIAYFVLLIVLLYAPAYMSWFWFGSYFKTAGRMPNIALRLLFALWYALLSVAGMCGCAGEKTRLPHGLREGFARWKRAWLLFPWAVSLVYLVPRVFASSAVWMENAPWKFWTAFTCMVLIMLTMAFPCAEIAAAPPGTGIGRICRDAIRSFRSGWRNGLSAAVIFWVLLISGLYASLAMGMLLYYVFNVRGEAPMAVSIVLFLLFTAYFSAAFCAFFTRLLRGGGSAEIIGRDGVK